MLCQVDSQQVHVRSFKTGENDAGRKVPDEILLFPKVLCCSILKITFQNWAPSLSSWNYTYTLHLHHFGKEWHSSCAFYIKCTFSPIWSPLVWLSFYLIPIAFLCLYFIEWVACKLYWGHMKCSPWKNCKTNCRVHLHQPPIPTRKERNRQAQRLVLLHLQESKIWCCVVVYLHPGHSGFLLPHWLTLHCRQ